MGAKESIELYDRNTVPEMADDFSESKINKIMLPSSAGDETGSLQRTLPRPMWYTIVGLVVILIVVILTLGLRCGLDPECTAFGTPSLGTFINNTHTSPLATTSVTMLMGIHYIITVSTIHTLPLKGTGFLRVLLLITSLLLYASVFAAIIYSAWFMAIIPVGIGVVWSGETVLALRRLYRYSRKRMPFRISLCIFVIYTLTSTLYLVFSAVPIPNFPGRQIGVFVTEIVMLVSGLLYLIMLVFHTRRVAYIFQTTKMADHYSEV